MFAFICIVQEIVDDDEFVVNEEFTAKLRKVRVPLVASEASSSSSGGGDGGAADGGGGGSAASATAEGEGGGVDGEGLSAALQEYRRNIVEAVIVRVLKARKSVSHNDLVAEVTHQLFSRFVPSVQLIRTRIESLIDREYLRRSDSDRKIYEYTA